jgi:hypothetical protein
MTQHERDTAKSKIDLEYAFEHFKTYPAGEAWVFLERVMMEYQNVKLNKQEYDKREEPTSR